MLHVILDLPPIDVKPEPLCRDCGTALPVGNQSDGKGGQYAIVTCFNPACDLRHVTRELTNYLALSADELEAYRAMNRSYEKAV